MVDLLSLYFRQQPTSISEKFGAILKKTMNEGRITQKIIIRFLESFQVFFINLIFKLKNFQINLWVNLLCKSRNLKREFIEY